MTATNAFKQGRQPCTISCENEAICARQSGEFDYIVPAATIKIEAPVQC